jgi:hypothetical protein
MLFQLLPKMWWWKGGIFKENLDNEEAAMLMFMGSLVRLFALEG